MPLVEAGRWTISYDDVGAGPCVLLIHGLAGDHRAWRPQIDSLSTLYRVIAIDNPGCGASSPVERATSMGEIAASVTLLMDKLGIARAHVIGRSMGGAIAQEIAIRSPERVSSLTLAGSFALLDPLGVRLIENMRDLIKDGLTWWRWARLFSFAFVSPEWFNADPARLARLEDALGDEGRDRDSYIHLANATLMSDTSERIRAFERPVLILGGRHDPICSPGTIDHLASCVARPVQVYFEHSSHFFLMEEAEAVNDHLLRWIAEHENSQP